MIDECFYCLKISLLEKHKDVRINLNVNILRRKKINYFQLG